MGLGESRTIKNPEPDLNPTRTEIWELNFTPNPTNSLPSPTLIKAGWGEVLLKHHHCHP